MSAVAIKSHDRAKAYSRTMTSEEYHACPELSNSGNNIILDETPAHFKFYKDNPRPPTKAMITGQIVHLLTLEPDKFLETAVTMPKVDRRTTAGKEYAEKFEIDNIGKLILDNDLYHQAFGMIGSIMAHPAARAILQKNHNELSFFGELEGVKVRCRPDILREGKLLADLKTTEDASFNKFQKTIVDHRYARQAAFYADLVSQVTGETYDTFTFIAVEKKPPYAVQVFALDEASLEKGREEYQRGLAIYRQCLLTNKWPGYSDEVVPMNLPSWAF
jgi:hypothetical protein